MVGEWLSGREEVKSGEKWWKMVEKRDRRDGSMLFSPSIHYNCADLVSIKVAC